MASQKLALCVLLACFSASFLSSVSAEPVKLTDKTFETEVNDGKVWFIKFFAPWCGHCKRLVPTWEDLSKEFTESADVVIASVDCTVETGTCSKAEVRSYPTLKIYHKGEEVKKYAGARELSALKTFAETAASELVRETTE
eukprot:TRINITY_DN20800_c0_g1_i1.p1 TRINITY_DN20800_c0_g1~~TRINITY_DN20800_c0_g1_i1.p1  ORF type:complete len:141 (-),score=31.69 TRINITY_DN20800_c0_g1_i1:317-739(-)